MPKIKTTRNKISIPSSLDYLAMVDEFVEKRLRKARWPESQLADIAISVTEAVTNAVVHGNKKDLSKKVEVEVLKTDKEVRIRIQDEGNGFDPADVPNPIESENLLKEVGRGIFILRSLMDKVEFKNLPGNGTLVTMIKYHKKE